MGSRIRRVFFGAALACATLSAAAPAFADPSLSDKETARSLMEDADGKRDKGDLKGALKSYEEADAIMHVPTTGLEVARTQAALGLLLEARETLLRVSKIPAKPGEPPPFVAARKTADQLSTEIAARIPTVTIALTNVDPAQTPAITFDGESVPAAAAQAPRKVDPGPHVIVVKAGPTEKREELKVQEKDARTVTIDMTPSPEKPAAPPPPPPPGGTSSGGGAAKGLMYGGFALGVIGIGVGSVTGIMSLSKVSDVKKQCNGDACPPEQADAISSAKSLGTVSTIAFIAGGVGVALGVVGILIAPSKKDDAQPAPAALTVRRGDVALHADVGPTWMGLSGTF